VKMIQKTDWERTGQTNPFLSYNFHEALLRSGSIGNHSGWELLQIFSQDQCALLNCYLKDHSYGEYIFDWTWAQAYERSGRNYYPKLISMVPFSPVNVPHFLMPKWSEQVAENLLLEFEQIYQDSQANSAHFLFLPEQEIDIFKKAGYLIRESIQYHFYNSNFFQFSDFLSTLKTKKAKTIDLERSFHGLEISQTTGEKLQDQHALRMYQYYLSTIKAKGSFAYLNEDFFLRIFQTLKKNLLFVEARDNEIPIAGSLFLFDKEKLYGRYWGSHKYIPNLHFELCYYQGIEFCLRNSLKIFEAGAQGEHKIARGFRPVKVYSAHKMKDKIFQIGIDQFIESEKIHIDQSYKLLSERLPFKN
jgi:predicted N-acyltransferase